MSEQIMIGEWTLPQAKEEIEKTIEELRQKLEWLDQACRGTDRAGTHTSQALARARASVVGAMLGLRTLLLQVEWLSGKEKS